ncbi:MAG: amidohydrolase family protein [bacterium]|nr:amidohydrolase family protein [bacterium]
MSKRPAPRFVISGGSVFDSDSGRLVERDIYVADGIIVEGFEVEPHDGAIKADGLLVTPGWIDLHTHVFRGQDLGVDADVLGPATGVTTMVDAGSAGAHVFAAFQSVMREYTTTIRPFLNISSIGTTSIHLAGELRLAAYADEQACIECIGRHPEIVGVKVRASANVGAENTLVALAKARRVATEVDLPLMVHVGPAPATMAEVLANMRAGDIITHCFSGLTDTPIARIDAEADLLKEASNAQERGVIFDVGHGGGSFDAKRAAAAMDAGFLPDTISSDVHTYAAPLSTEGLPLVVDKFLALGLSLEATLTRVTARPARAIALDGGGTLLPGSPADIAMFQLTTGEYEFVDSNGYRFTGTQRLHPTMTIKDGKIVFDKSEMG